MPIRLAAVADLDAGGVPARLYVPDGDPAPLLVYLHGGGWTVGSLESHDPLCRTLADGAAIRVLAVDYRLSPEHRWLASIDDAVAVLRRPLCRAPWSLTEVLAAIDGLGPADRPDVQSPAPLAA